MDSDDLLLMYLPYCIYKKIITPLDELIADNQQLFAEFGLDNDAKQLFDILSEKRWTVDDFLNRIKQTDCPEIVNTFKSITKVGLRQGGDQSLLSQVFALCDHVEMLELELRLQNQHISQIQRPEPIIIRANREDYGPPSPINCVDELEDEVEFG